MYDGSIVIGTELSTNKFDKQIGDLDRKINKEEDKKIIIETKLTNQEQELERARKKVDELADAYQNMKEAQERIKAGGKRPSEFTENFATIQNLQAQYGSLEKIDSAFQKALDKQDALELKVQETKNKYEAINNEISQYKQKIESINIQKQKADVDQLKGSIDKVGNSFSGAVKKAGRLAIAIFGIRSAYMLLQRASSELSGYDEQYATNLEYIRFVLTQAIAPVLKYIVNLAMQLLGWINAILQAWFGINLFANGSVESFQKMKKGASGVGKAVKEIKKQLLGFDEVNVLSSQSDTGTSAGAGGVGAMPEIDLSAWQGEVPDWLQWIIDHRDEILAILAGIATGLTLIKFGMSGIKALGIGLMVAGIVYTIQSLIEYLKDPSWKNFGKVLQGIGIAIIGLGALIGSVPVAVAGAIVLIIGTITKYWEQIKAFFQKGIDWLAGKSDWVHQMFGDTIGNIYDLFTRTLQNLLNIFDSFFKMLKGVFDGIIKFIKGVFTGNWKKAWEGIKDIFSSIWNGIKGIFKGVIRIIGDMTVTVAKTTGKIISSAFKAVVNGVMGAIERILNAPIRAINGLINVINAVPGINLGYLSTFNLPRLAVGGIVNMPNKGTLVGGAITGESGREGVIPLTDQQTMAELGREIGKNVLVNLTNITQMNGRVISRELKQVRSTQEFAYNM